MSSFFSFVTGKRGENWGERKAVASLYIFFLRAHKIVLKRKEKIFHLNMLIFCILYRPFLRMLTLYAWQCNLVTININKNNNRSIEVLFWWYIMKSYNNNNGRMVVMMKIPLRFCTLFLTSLNYLQRNCYCTWWFVSASFAYSEKIGSKRQ